MPSPRTISCNDVRRILAAATKPMTAQDVRDHLGIEGGGGVGTTLGALARRGELVAHPGDGPRQTAYSLAPGIKPPAKNASRAPRTGDVPRPMVQTLQPAPTHTGDSPERRAALLALPPADELRCAIFHDGTFAIDKAGVPMTLEPHECARLYEFLDQQSPIWQDKIKSRRKGAKQ